jgi:BioD-like phosphotransacetylase family protein
MVALHIVSAQAASGKTAIAIGLGRRLMDEGKKVGFLRLAVGEKESQSPAADAAFAQHVFDLKEVLSPSLGSEKTLADRAREVYIEVSQNKDVVIIESSCGTKSDDDSSKSAYEIARALKAKVIVVEDYAGEKAAPRYLDIYRGFGENLLGFILNKVPGHELKRTCEELTSRISESGMRILGVLPEERALAALTVGELAEGIDGEVLNNGEKSAELVENIMVGAMCIDSGIDYFGRKTGKAAVIRNDRPDMQMAALETATRCLVISGGGEPIDYVRLKADEKGIPLITTNNDTDTVIKHIEDLLDGTRLHQEKKLGRLAELLHGNLDLKAIYAGLGLS